ncbi:MAG: 1-deoxy-D-xylulose 5-phosphate reductoisomerase [Deltaproteobacteria bacterium]|nr:1-deoxy-D-xylulose 5-phosphate reductoisomerase [Deltaproteobacteria bacterium]
MKKRIVVLGSTGSIGRATLDVIEQHRDTMEVYGLACRENTGLFSAQIKKFKPTYACLFDAARAGKVEFRSAKKLTGPEGMKELARVDADMIVNALPGSIGLEPTLEALKGGRRLALANKESLVMAGRVIRKLLKKGRAGLIPVDSEHSALYQLLNCIEPSELQSLTLTASGGPFRKHTKAQLRMVSSDEAMKHPTWNMGKKITLDSATLANKGLEVIEARWLFDIEPEHIKVLVHPESIVHGIAELRDGSLLAYLAYPDMRVPISFALNEGVRTQLPFGKVDLARLTSLSFAHPDQRRFPALRLAYEALAIGDSAQIVYNASNEVAATAFMEGRIRFTDIPRLMEEALNRHAAVPKIEDVEEIVNIHHWTVRYVEGRLRRSRG